MQFVAFTFLFLAIPGPTCHYLRDTCPLLAYVPTVLPAFLTPLWMLQKFMNRLGRRKLCCEQLYSNIVFFLGRQRFLFLAWQRFLFLDGSVFLLGWQRFPFLDSSVFFLGRQRFPSWRAAFSFLDGSVFLFGRQCFLSWTAAFSFLDGSVFLLGRQRFPSRTAAFFFLDGSVCFLGRQRFPRCFCLQGAVKSTTAQTRVQLGRRGLSPWRSPYSQ